MSKHLLIIGAGIAGLAAGIYAQRSGLNVTILEQHTLPGGMCTSWRRKGYLFEGALHWLTGSSPQNPLHTLWREVGALDDTVKLYYDDPYRSVQHEGQRIFLYRDLQKLQKHFDDISPEDAATTKGLIRDIRRYTRVAMPISDMRGVSVVGPRRSSLGTILKMMPSLPLMARANRLTVTDYLSHFKHPGIQLVLGTLVPEDYSAASLLFSLATMASGDGANQR
ncbi:MAG: FAD-dependent oxidoreductase [Eubacteriaceae bacterium]|nr:FAD-dependent oxidoreductase [Eubacteriaceae bacterium]